MSSKSLAAELSAAAEKLRSELDASDIDNLRLNRGKLEIIDVNTDGFAAVIGSLKGGPWIELWLDRYAGGGQRKYSCCFEFRNKAQADEYIGRVVSYEVKSLNDDSYSKKTKFGKTYMALRAPITYRSSMPVYHEVYSQEGNFYLTLYTPATTSVEFSYSRAVDFFKQFSTNTSAPVSSEGKTIQKFRIGQAKFRKKLLAHWEGRCAVTGSALTELLKASHIKPWESSSTRERLDLRNGLLLEANLDCLFDQHLITFADDGRMLVSSSVSDELRDALQLRNRCLRRDLHPATLAYLRHHRSKAKDCA